MPLKPPDRDKSYLNASSVGYLCSSDCPVHGVWYKDIQSWRSIEAHSLHFKSCAINRFGERGSNTFPLTSSYCGNYTDCFSLAWGPPSWVNSRAVSPADEPAGVSPGSWNPRRTPHAHAGPHRRGLPGLRPSARQQAGRQEAPDTQAKVTLGATSSELCSDS